MNKCGTFLSKKPFHKGFVLTYDRMRRFEGIWHLERKLLFPAHIFFESEDQKALYEELKKCSVLNEIKNGLFSVGEEEQTLLKELCGESGNLRMSEGIIRNGIPKIIKGPLKGMESRIKKIDRHKRLARIEAADSAKKECSGDKWKLGSISAGLEIIEKIV